MLPSYYTSRDYIFLSTLSLRRATRRNPQDLSLINYFYPRSPCGERRCQAVPLTVVHTFLSTLSLRRATVRYVQRLALLMIFLSTLSLRRATAVHIVKVQCVVHISIHALLAESDTNRRELLLRYQVFLSTLSLRRATSLRQPSRSNRAISIHALLAESDVRTVFQGGI